MITKKRALGNLGENLACKYLVKNGFEIVFRNYWKPWGEIDIIGQKDGIFHFFEVKTVSSGDICQKSHSPEENVHGWKMRKIGRMVETFFMERGMSEMPTFKFHVLCVFIHEQRKIAKIRMISDLVI